MRWTLGLVAVAIIAGMWWHWHRRVPAAPVVAQSAPATPVVSPPAPPAAPSQKVPAPDVPGAPPRAIAPPPAATPPLLPPPASDLKQPPPDTPVKDVLALLRPAADQGVARAACRVGVELIRCGRIRQRMSEFESAMAAATNTPKDTQSAQAAMRRATALHQQLANDQRACAGVSDEETQEAWRYVYAAAAGNVAGMSRFARDPGMLGGPNSPEYAEAWAAYRRDAPQFRADAIHGGDVRALYYGWWAALNGTSAAGSGVFPAEPETAVLYASALRGLVDDRTMQTINQMTARVAAGIDPERAELLRQQGEALRAQSFPDAKPIEPGNDLGKTDVADCWK